MLARIRTMAGGAALLVLLAACGGSTQPTAIPTAVPIGSETAAPIAATAYPAPTIAAPAATTAYPGTNDTEPSDMPSAYPGATTTP